VEDHVPLRQRACFRKLPRTRISQLSDASFQVILIQAGTGLRFCLQRVTNVVEWLKVDLHDGNAGGYVGVIAAVAAISVGIETVF
jgi:hypothetical protein